jgi:hypothetical protein
LRDSGGRTQQRIKLLLLLSSYTPPFICPVLRPRMPQAKQSAQNWLKPPSTSWPPVPQMPV